MPDALVYLNTEQGIHKGKIKVARNGILRYQKSTGKMRQLVVVRRICCCSQFMIFLLELLGPAKQPMAGPSSSNRKIMD